MDGERRGGTLATVFVVVGLALSAIGVAYMMYAGRPRQLPALTTQPAAARPPVEQAEAMMAMLTYSFIIFMVFLIGAYIIVRVGRHFREKYRPASRSELVDIWSNYRLSEEEIESAAQQWEALWPQQPEDDQRPPDEPQE